MIPDYSQRLGIFSGIGKALTTFPETTGQLAITGDDFRHLAPKAGARKALGLLLATEKFWSLRLKALSANASRHQIL
jgi:hypothetical protein